MRMDFSPGTGVQHGGVQAVRVQHREHGEAQFPVQERNAADHVLGEELRGAEEGLEAHRHGHLLLRELLQERQQGARILHDRVVHGRIPVRPGRMLLGLRIPVHVFHVIGEYTTVRHTGS